MALARTVLLLGLFVALAGFMPVGGCAKGCSAGCKGGSTVARSGVHGADDLARSLPRGLPRNLPRNLPSTAPGRLGVRPPIVVPGHVGGELVEGGVLAHLDDAVAALPAPQGPASALAKAPAANGKVMVAGPGARSFADDYARSIGDLGLTRKQHELVLDAFDHAQSILEEVMSDAGPDDRTASELAQRASISRQARELSNRLEETLEPRQRQRLYDTLGEPQVIVYRLSRERPMQHPAPAWQRPASGGSAAPQRATGIDLR